MNGSVNKMNYNFKRKLNNVKVISAGVSLVILLSGCTINPQAINSETTKTIETTANIETTSNSSIQSSMTETEPIESQTTLEPFECDIATLADFGQYLNGLGYDIYSNNMPYQLGYDNPHMSQLINDYMASIDSEYTNLTAEDFNYFIASSDQLTCYGNTGSTDYSYNRNTYPSELLILIQSVLIENNLRMTIDEIPYQYFEERFPEFVADQSAEYQEDLYNQYYEIICRIYNESNNSVDMSGLSDYEYEIVLYRTLTGYNNTRFLYMYSGHVDQIREESTGRNILDPTESQLEDINERFGVAVGGDVTQVETREHFYETYGMYPEDALYRETRYEGNLTETNSMYSEAPSRQR